MEQLKIFGSMTVLALALSACGQQQGNQGAKEQGATPSDSLTVKIGQASPLSGPISHLGKDVENGARLAIDDLNKDGVVINGQKVHFELESVDDQGDPKVATQMAQRLVDSGVVGVVGHLNSGTSIPASKIYSDAGIPQISPSATNPAFTAQGYKTTFRMIANDVQQGSAMGKFAAAGLHAKTVAIIDDRTAYGQGLADEFEKAAKANGIVVVKREFTTNVATDFTAILTAIKANQPDLIYYGGMDAQAGPMAKQMKRLGLKSKLIGGDSIQTPEFMKLAGDAAEGTYASACGVPREKMAGFTDFEKRFKASFNVPVQVFSPYEYDAVKVLVDAMKRAGSTDPKRYLPELAKTSYAGITGNIAFDAKGDVKDGAITVYQAKAGKWEVVSTTGGL
ncbi:branched-chain amino acid ABC transporter substrate-binding protein [Aquitalea magnusonii]|uniref:Branched-chain amino acid transport system substrate-binding protein n=1 Tax=Aquitalea magnusonii TaxID=332411 RepID=A0A318JY98_9NEIS|nr:branched-chain amino acid ABC transporter substrate-binding protein [Aquitalea magnusonii]PXX45739.1 branched-chain amino acid transport system substrate-binding protein [Aquitalea magnusonii]